MCWARGKNGRGAANEESGCDQSGGQKEKIKTATKTGGLFEDKFAGIVRVVEILVDRRGRWRLLAETAVKRDQGARRRETNVDNQCRCLTPDFNDKEESNKE